MLKGPFDAESLVVLALRNSPDLAMLREEIEMARADRAAAFDIPDPELRLSYSSQSDINTERQVTPEINAEWIDAVPYRQDFVPEFGWFYTGEDSVWKSTGSRPWWLWDSQEQAWTKQSGDVEWRTTDPAGRYVDTITGDILTPAEVLDTYTGTTRESQGGDSYQAALRFFPPNFHAIGHRKAAAEARILMAQSKVKAGEWLLTTAVMEAFENAQYRQEKLETLNQMVTTSKKIESILEERVKSGGATMQDLIKASWQNLKYISDRDTCEREVSLLLQELSSYTGLSASELSLSDSKIVLPKIDVSKLNTEQLEAIAAKCRADVNAMVWQIEAASAAAREMDAEQWPWLTHIQASFGKSRQDSVTERTLLWEGTDGKSYPIRDTSTFYDHTDGDEWGIEAAINLPVFASLTDRTAPARAEVRRCRTELVATLRTVMGEVQIAADDLKTAEANLAKFERDSSAGINRMRKILADIEASSAVPEDQVLAMRSDIIEAESAKKQIDHSYRFALISLAGAIGQDLETAMQTMAASTDTAPVTQVSMPVEPVRTTAEPIKAQPEPAKPKPEGRIIPAKPDWTEPGRKAEEDPLRNLLKSGRRR